MKFLVKAGGKLKIYPVFHCGDGVYYQSTLTGYITRIADRVTGTQAELEWCVKELCQSGGDHFIGQVEELYPPTETPPEAPLEDDDYCDTTVDAEKPNRHPKRHFVTDVSKQSMSRIIDALSANTVSWIGTRDQLPELSAEVIAKNELAASELQILDEYRMAVFHGT